MSGHVDGAVAGDILGAKREGTDRTGQKCETYTLAEALLRHLAGDGKRGEVRITFSLDDASWAKYRSEVARPYRGEPALTVVPVPGVGAMEFTRARGRQDGLVGIAPGTYRDWTPDDQHPLRPPTAEEVAAEGSMARAIREHQESPVEPDARTEALSR